MRGRKKGPRYIPRTQRRDFHFQLFLSAIAADRKSSSAPPGTLRKCPTTRVSYPPPSTPGSVFLVRNTHLGRQLTSHFIFSTFSQLAVCMSSSPSSCTAACWPAPWAAAKAAINSFAIFSTTLTHFLSYTSAISSGDCAATAMPGATSISLTIATVLVALIATRKSGSA